MIFYRIDWRDSEPTARTTDWATNQRRASRLARESGDPDVRITPINIDPSKEGLLAFLQENIWCDAGRAIAQAQRD